MKIRYHASNRIKTAVCFRLLEGRDILATGVLYHREAVGAFFTINGKPDLENIEKWRLLEHKPNLNFGGFEIPEAWNFVDSEFQKIMNKYIYDAFKHYNEGHLAYTAINTKSLGWVIYQYQKSEGPSQVTLLGTRYGSKKESAYENVAHYESIIPKISEKVVNITNYA